MQFFINNFSGVNVKKFTLEGAVGYLCLHLGVYIPTNVLQFPLWEVVLLFKFNRKKRVQKNGP